MWPLFAGFCLFLSFFPIVASTAAISCSADGAICLESSSQGDGLDIWVDAKNAGTFTFSLEQNLTNLFAPKVLPATYFLEKGRSKLFSLVKKATQLPWRYSYRFFSQNGWAMAAPENYAYSLPFSAGRLVRVTQGFHGSFSHFGEVNEYAIDFDVAEGTPIYAARGGVVVRVVQNFEAGGPTQDEERANVVQVEHRDHTVAEYAHLRRNGAAVRVGQEMNAGDLVGYSGNSGRTSGPHLHFAVHLPIDGKRRRSIPIQFLVRGKAIELLVNHIYAAE